VKLYTEQFESNMRWITFYKQRSEVLLTRGEYNRAY